MASGSLKEMYWTQTKVSPKAYICGYSCYEMAVNKYLLSMTLCLLLFLIIVVKPTATEYTF